MLKTSGMTAKAMIITMLKIFLDLLVRASDKTVACA